MESEAGNFDVADDHLRSGLTLLRERLADGEVCQELADFHFARYNIVGRLGDEAGVAETARELLSIAERLASPRAEAEANLVASVSSLWRSDFHCAREHALRALTIGESFPEGQELAICGRAHVTLAMIAMRLGDHRSMHDHAERGLSVARQLGSPSSEVYLRFLLSYADFLSGAWQESLRHSTEAIAIARRMGHPRDLATALAGRGVILALKGDLFEAQACISEARLAFSSGSTVDRHVFGLIDMTETALALERGQVERALGIARGFLHFAAWTVTPAGLSLPNLPVGFMILAEVQVAARDLTGALETAHKIVRLGPTSAPYLTALASRAEGLARLALGQDDNAALCYCERTKRSLPFRYHSRLPGPCRSGPVRYRPCGSNQPRLLTGEAWRYSSALAPVAMPTAPDDSCESSAYRRLIRLRLVLTVVLSVSVSCK